MTYDEIVEETEEKMAKSVENFGNELRGIRTGRATSGLVENIRVEYYGTLTPLKQIANISIPEARQIVIRPFDNSSIKNIEKAILKSELGITPTSDGRMLRLNVPPLSEERRQQLASQVKELSEKAKVSIRNIRRDSIRKADQLEKDSTISEDENEELKEEIQKFTKTYEEKVVSKYEEKRKEILEI